MNNDIIDLDEIQERYGGRNDLLGSRRLAKALRKKAQRHTSRAEKLAYTSLTNRSARAAQLVELKQGQRASRVLGLMRSGRSGRAKAWRRSNPKYRGGKGLGFYNRGE